jgi:hypothetical protein
LRENPYHFVNHNKIMGFYLMLGKRVIPPPWHEDGITVDG